MYKILNINNYHYPRGGSERYFLQLTQLLIDHGHDVKTFSTGKEKITNPEWIIGEPVKGVDTESAKSITNVTTFIYSADAKEKMVKAIEKFKPDIAHLHIYHGHITASILSVLKQFKIPVVQTLHDFKLVCPTQDLVSNGKYCADCKGRNYWNAVLNRCNRGSFSRSFLSMTEAYAAELFGSRTKVDKFIAVSHYQKNKLVELGVEANKISVLHHYADISDNYSEHPGKYFLYVGRIHDGKGIKTLLDAYAKLKVELSSSPEQSLLPFKIAGDGNSLKYWKDYAIKLGLKDGVEWLGFCDDKQLDKLYKHCIVLINPSQLNETFGLTNLEALARGKAVIASDAGAFSEVVTEGEDALLITAESVDELCSAMNKIIQGDLDVKQMGNNGFNNIKKKFQSEKHYQQLMNIYASTIEKYQQKTF